ncbi:cellulose binding domain-containing protein [Lentzea flaviverrucosa]|uniref:Glycosyl hydrolases family 16 n=1 Tax=Lentzea flaviverrucosa TaxID=200379 RepID=A0A1H9CSG2_9PSEU|nr:cellulose binding domain-containing protein [Lentzea flaviverrucosa]RDI24635.1 glycosyl hydrolase family 16 [Lentzea flaviverrucosa]SEQ04162.1 Glycosyl hydrolases family 16 [Lentzea flaviverrucosa]
MRALLAASCAALAVAALAVAPNAFAADAITAQYRTSASGATTDQAEPWFKLVNSGSTSVPLSDLKIRYYFKSDTPDVGYRFACSWAVRGCGNVTGQFGTLTGGPADRYLEVGFTSGAGTLNAGADSGDLQLRFYRTNWGPITQTDDYSFRNQSSYSAWNNITVHRGGTLLWGTPPGGSPPTTTTTTTTAPNPNGPKLFDDFAYNNSSDSRIGQRGWTVRSGGGGPGVPGAEWDASRITFPTVEGQKVMRLDSWNNGSAAKQTELYHQRKFFEGTYASRVKFSDAPVFGPDGDHVVQTFFTITPLDAPMAPNYGEIDFEYLPNGGWGEPANVMYETTWETYQNEPWVADNIHNEQRQSYNGWHDLVFQVANGRVKYYIDGNLVADHGDKYYPETPMSINFNLWFISGGLQGSSAERAYQQEVDYVYFAKDQVLSPAQVKTAVQDYRNAGVTHTDNV